MTVEHPENGVYCISGLSGTLHNVVATIDADESVEKPQLVPMYVTATLGQSTYAKREAVCASAQVTVETWSPIVTENSGTKVITATTADSGFYITIN